MPLTYDHSDDSFPQVIGETRPREFRLVSRSSGSNEAVPRAGVTDEQATFPASKHWLVRRLGDRWTYPILDTLRRGPMRFAKLKAALDPISQRMLTLSLKKLERDGLVNRNRCPGSLLHVTYELTTAGMSLLEILAPFDGWLEANRQHILEANKSFFGRH